MATTTTTAPATTTTTTTRKPRRAARVTTATVRVIIGLLFTMTGANGFLNFMPGDPSAMSEGALKFNIALAETGYMIELASAVQLIAGILLLTNRYVPLALTMLAPMVINIFLFHVFLEPSGLVLAVIVSAVEVYLAWVNRDAFRAVLRATAR